MNLKMLAPLTITGIICAATLAAGAIETPAVPATARPAAVATPPPSPSAAMSPAAAEKMPKAAVISIRLNAPVFSEQFAKVPLALVNDEPITMEDFKKTLGTIHEGMVEGQAAPKKNFPELLKRLVNSLLIIQEARTMELDKQEEIKTSVDEYSRKLLREMLLKEQVKNVKADSKEVEKVYRQRTAEWRLKSLIVDKAEDVKAIEASLKGGKKFDALYEAAIKDSRAKEGGKSDIFLTRDVIAPPMLVVLEKMKNGEVSKTLPLEKGYLIFRLEETRHVENAAVKEQVQQELDGKARISSLEAFQTALIKQYVTKKKLFDKFDFENKKVKFEDYLKDKRSLADIKGEKPVTVADMAIAIAEKFYHGVERAAEAKKINKEKKAILNQLLGTIVFNKEAKVRGIDQSEAYLTKVRSYSNSLLFGTFVTKVVRPEITVTKDELQAYYKNHSGEYTTVDFYKLDAIAFDSPQKAEEAVEKLRKGMDFKWYKANADGRVSISKSFAMLFEGDAIAKPNLPEPMQKAVAGAAKGDYRVFTDGSQGYALAIVEHEPARTRTFAEVEEVVKEAVFYEKLNKGVESWADKLRSSSDVTMFADFAE
jgi:parvulin-like peptidyl-prolyl isomerase